MTGQNQHNWLDFFCQETFFDVLGKSVDRVGLIFSVRKRFLTSWARA